MLDGLVYVAVPAVLTAVLTPAVAVLLWRAGQWAACQIVQSLHARTARAA